MCGIFYFYRMKKVVLICIIFCFTSVVFGQKEKETQARFDSLVLKGDSFFNLNQFVEARRQYELSLSLKPTETEVMNKIVLCMELENVERLRKEADAYFEQKDFQAAKKKYLELLKVKVKDEYASNRIQQIDEYLAD